MIDVTHYIILSVLLFSIGLAITITKKNVIVVLMGLELILNAATINLVSFSKFQENVNGEVIAVFLIVLAVCEAALALAIVMKAVKKYRTSNLNEINQIAD